jgi:hypothetical protein
MILLDMGRSDRDLRHDSHLPDRPGNGRPAITGEVQPPAEVLAKIAVSAAIGTKDAIDAELFGVVRMGLMVSSARPGVKRLMFVLTDRTNPSRKAEVALLTGANGGTHLTLVADSCGRTDDVARFDLKDAGAGEALRVTVERFVTQMVEKFAQAATR